MVPHNQDLLQAILQDPDNDELRLVYADWLEDHGCILPQLRRSGNWFLIRDHAKMFDVKANDGKYVLLMWNELVIGYVKGMNCDFCRREALMRILGNWRCENCDNFFPNLTGAYSKQLYRNKTAKCPTCGLYVEKLVDSGCCQLCDQAGWVMGRRGWRQLGDYDG